MSMCEYIGCDQTAEFTVLELYNYADDDEAFYDVVGLNVCLRHIPSTGIDPRCLWSERNAHLYRKIGDDDPNFEVLKCPSA